MRRGEQRLPPDRGFRSGTERAGGGKLQAKSSKVKEPRARDRLQPHEVEKLLAMTEKSTKTIEGLAPLQRYWLYSLAIITGLRRGELGSLLPSNFERFGTAMTVTVRARDTKSKRKAVQPIPTSMIESLSAWLTTVDGHLFPSLVTRKTSVMIRRDLVAAAILHKTPNGVRCFHSLRNGYISSLWDANVPATVIKDLARHRDIKLTEHYARHLDGALQNAVDRAAFGVSGNDR